MIILYDSPPPPPPLGPWAPKGSPPMGGPVRDSAKARPDARKHNQARESTTNKKIPKSGSAKAQLKITFCFTKLRFLRRRTPTNCMWFPVAPGSVSVELSRFPHRKFRNVMLRCVYCNLLFYGVFIICCHLPIPQCHSLCVFYITDSKKYVLEPYMQKHARPAHTNRERANQPFVFPYSWEAAP